LLISVSGDRYYLRIHQLHVLHTASNIMTVKKLIKKDV